MKTSVTPRPTAANCGGLSPVALATNDPDAIFLQNRLFTWFDSVRRGFGDTAIAAATNAPGDRRLHDVFD